MRIAIVTHMLYPEHIGGREKYVVRLAEEWSSRHEVGIVCYTETSVFSGLVRNVRIHGVQWIPKPFLISQVMLVLTTVIDTLIHGYELVYVNSSTGPELAGLFNRIFTGTPYVVAVHNPSELFSKSFRRLSYYVKRMVLKNASHVIAVSKELANLLSQYDFVHEDKITFIPPGVEQELLEYTIKNRTKGTVKKDHSFTAITSRRLVKEKGLDVLLKAVKILVTEGLEVNCIIVGTGEELDSLVALSGELDIDSHVTFTGYVSDERLWNLISSADCYVIPSRREGTPVALFEAMALGKPVVATSVGGIPDIIRNDELIASVDDPAELAEKIGMLLKDKPLTNSTGRKNRENARYYTWSKIAARIFTVFENVLLQN